MPEEVTPFDALVAADSARSAATGRIVPSWFPTAAGSTCAVGLTLLGASLLSGGATRWALGVAGWVVVAGYFALWGVLVSGWRHQGVIPSPPSLDRRLTPARRCSMLVADFVALAVSVAVLAATGSLASAAIVAGWLGGAALWYRLRLRVA